MEEMTHVRQPDAKNVCKFNQQKGKGSSHGQAKKAISKRSRHQLGDS
jgi:hypothetical protein